MKKSNLILSVLTNTGPEAQPDELFEREGRSEADVGGAIEVRLGALRRAERAGREDA